MRVIYFVCMSNTCRSPMAEHLMKEKLALENLQNKFEVRSRGITDAYEKPGSPASSQGVEVLKNDYNIDMSSHKSALLTATDVNEAHMIIPVKRDLGRHIAHMYPDSVPKLKFLPHDISDPWHQPVSVYRNCAQDVYGMLDAIVVELKAGLTTDEF